MNPLNIHRATKIGLNVFLLLVFIVALRLGQTVFVPTIIALILASVLMPAVEWLNQKLRMNWTVAALTVIFGLVFINLGVTTILGMTAVRLTQQIPSPHNEPAFLKMYGELRTKIEGVADTFHIPMDTDLFPKDPQKVHEIQVFTYLSDKAPAFINETASLGMSWLWSWVIIIFILLFMLMEGRYLSQRIKDLFGSHEEIHGQVADVLEDMAKQVRTYLVWRTIINFGLAIVIGVFYQVSGLKQAWTWAILLAILNYIPYLGPLLAGIPPFFDALLSCTNPMMVVVVVAVYWAIIISEGYLIVPLLMGRSMDLNATTVMLACLFWDLVWGMTGLFLAMPIMAGLKAILHHVPEWRPWANLMSTEEALADETPTPAAMARSESEA